MRRLGHRLLAMVTSLLRQSSRVHLRTTDIQTLRELIDLIDRFADDQVRYPLEWDDFVSWRNSNPNIEEIRNRIGLFEPLLFSGSKRDRDEYVLRLVEERDIAAALVGLPARQAMRRPNACGGGTFDGAGSSLALDPTYGPRGPRS